MGTSASLVNSNKSLTMAVQAHVQSKFGHRTYSHRDKQGQIVTLDCTINNSCMIAKTHHGVELFHDQSRLVQLQELDILLSTISVSFVPNSIIISTGSVTKTNNPLQTLLWRVVDRKMPVEAGDIIKLSLHVLKVVDIVVNRPERIKDYEGIQQPLSSQIISLPLDASCRVCYEQENTEANPILKPCRCQGSMSYIHLECLRKWILHGCGYSSTMTGLRVKKSALKCTVCQQPYSSGLFTSKSGLKSIFLEDGVKTPYIKLQVLSDSRSDDNFVIVESLADSITIGRSSQCQIKMGLDHLSRKHCRLSYDNNTKKVYIEDLGSSFATLKYIKEPMVMEGPDQYIRLQIQNTLLIFKSASKTHKTKNKQRCLDLRRLNQSS